MSTTIKILPCGLTDKLTATEIALLGINTGDVFEAPNHISRSYGMARYRLVKVVDSDVGTLAAGVWSAYAKCLFAATSDEWDVTIDASGGTARAGLLPIGMAVTWVDISEAPYAFVQITGIAAYTAGSASIIDGDSLKPDTAEDGDLDEATYGTHKNIIGWSIGTVADNAEGICMLTGCPV